MTSRFLVMALLCACSPGHAVTVKNDDSVELLVRVQTSDESLDWRKLLVGGASASLRVHPEGDITLATTVSFDGVVVQHRDKGYVSPSMADQRTCITVSRQRIEVSTCE
jgi:hypothetical protein